LDPFKEQVKKWVEEDHCYNCEAMLPRLLALGYKGSLSVLKRFVHPLRPAQAGHYPVIRYETKPGEQVQFDWVRRVGAYEIPVEHGRGRE
jgi:transposase